MNKFLGDIMDRLGKLGIAENTSIFFSGDNGGDTPLDGERGCGSPAPLGGKKDTKLEGDMRVPFIVEWAKPEKESRAQKCLPTEAGGMQTQLRTVTDIYPTMLAVAGHKASQGYTIDGFDLKKQLSGEVDRRRPESSLMYSPHAHRGNYFMTYRMGSWKLIYYYPLEIPQQPKALLYDLKDDPEERNELSSACPDKCKEVIRKIPDQLVKGGVLYPVDEQGSELNPFVYF